MPCIHIYGTISVDFKGILFVLKTHFQSTTRNLTTSLLAAVVLFSMTGCGDDPRKANFEKLIKSSNKARSIGHEDLAANDLKEALELLPANATSERTKSINLIYPEILALAADLRKSGRLSLSKTMYDRAIAIERDCTLPDKASASALKKETENMLDIEENILTKATSTNDLKTKEAALEATTSKFRDALAAGDYATIHKDGMKHLERVRMVSGEAAQLYESIRKVVLNALRAEDKFADAIILLKRDAKALDTFTEEDLKSADTDSYQNAFFLCTTLCDLGQFQGAAGELQDAEASARRSIHLANTLGGKMLQETALSQIALSDLLRMKGQNEQALALAKNSLTLLEKANSGWGYRVRCLALSARIEDALGNKQSAEKICSSIVEINAETRAIDDTITSLAVAAAYFQKIGNEKKFSQAKELMIAKIMSPKATFYARQAAFEMLGDSTRNLSKFAEAVSYYQRALKYSSKEHKVKLEEKISDCKMNKR